MQDKNAGNLGDILKHFYLLKLLKRVSGRHNHIAYIDSHAGAGVYYLDKTRVDKIQKFKKKVYPDKKAWKPFEKLNPLVNNEYYGSWVLAAKYLTSLRIGKKIILFDCNREVVRRIQVSIRGLSLKIPIRLTMKKVSPKDIKGLVKRLKREGFDAVVVLIDPFWKKGKEDFPWTEMLVGSEPGLYTILFDFSRASGKDDQGHLKCRWHAYDHLISFKTYAINGYAVFGNKLAYKVLN